MSAHGRKTRSPGFRAGGHWVVCDVCGMSIRANKAKRTWEGLVVCPTDYETRHPQEFVRGIADTIAAQGEVRTEPSEVFSLPQCSSREAVAGVAITGCAITGYSEPDIPAGTF